MNTIIERNNPKALDMSKHQLFIDTTRTYVYYDRVEKWNPCENEEQTSTLSKFDFKDFPRLWLTLRKYEGELILHDRCDGEEPSYGLTDSTFHIFGVHEMDIRKIKGIVKHNENELEIELEKFTGVQNETPLKVNIQKTERKGIYKLTTNLNDFGSTIFVTPKENVRNFDVLVNHCPINKVREFDDTFDY